jgi:YhcH/YjgK/YiaL family protein
MIFDSLENRARYRGLSYNLPAALQFLAENDLAALPVGRKDLDGNSLYLVVQESMTRPREQGKWEAHRKYIDIQYIARGEERMGFANLSTMQLGEYFPEKDFQAMTGIGNHVDVSVGSFAIFFPEDAHMPGLCVDTPKLVKKIVLKVKIEV